MTLRLVGIPYSQPTRAVAWLLQMRGVAYEFERKEDVLTGGCMAESYLRRFPQGTIPAIEDGAFRLTEGNAILQYLCTKHGWEDLYPAKAAAEGDVAALQRRATIDQWLHWHHTNLRPATAFFYRPLLRVTMGDKHFAGGLAKEEVPAQFAAGAKVLREAFTVMEYGALRKPKSQPFLAPTVNGSGAGSAESSGVSIADIAAYCELDQLEVIGGPCNELFDEFPLVRAWMDRMKQLPRHDEVREELRAMLPPIVDEVLGSSTRSE